MQKLIASLPQEARAQIATDPASLAEFTRSALVQNLLYAAAHAKAWDKRPEIAAAAERAREAEIVRLFVASEAGTPPAPTDADLHPLYDANKSRFMLPRQYHLAQIFLELPQGASPAASEARRAQLETLRQQIAARPDQFAAAAKQHSEDRHSAASGGDLGWLAEDKLVPDVKSAVSGLPVGAVSEPLRTSDGWHLIKLIETRPAGPASFEQARPLLAQAWREAKTRQAATAFVDSVLKRDPIELDQAALRAIAAPPP